MAACSKESTSGTAKITILGFGSLLSEKSSRRTFPDLEGFRLGRVPDHRRVFAHPAPIFFERGIANLESQEFCSLSAEPAPGCDFICSVFEVNSKDLVVASDDNATDNTNMIPSAAFLEREEEFDIQLVSYVDDADQTTSTATRKKGILCMRSSDEAYIRQWGQERFERQFRRWGLDTIWNYPRESSIKPCAAYLRHCVLAAEKMGKACYDSFCDETFLVDRTTTIRDYLKQHPDVMTTLPPLELAERYGG